MNYEFLINYYFLSIMNYEIMNQKFKIILLKIMKIWLKIVKIIDEQL